MHNMPQCVKNIVYNIAHNLNVWCIFKLYNTYNILCTILYTLFLYIVQIVHIVHIVLIGQIWYTFYTIVHVCTTFYFVQNCPSVLRTKLYTIALYYVQNCTLQGPAGAVPACCPGAWPLWPGWLLCNQAPRVEWSTLGAFKMP